MKFYLKVAITSVFFSLVAGCGNAEPMTATMVKVSNPTTEPTAVSPTPTVAPVKLLQLEESTQQFTALETF